MGKKRAKKPKTPERRPFPGGDRGRLLGHAVRRAEARARMLDPFLSTRSRIRGTASKGGPVTQAKSSPKKKKRIAPTLITQAKSSPKKKERVAKPKTGRLVKATVKVKGYTVKPHTRTMKVRVGQGVS
jgi:glycine cleavage system aminomethyltransferase T